MRAGALSDLSLTGERTLPGIPEENYWFRRHVAAYRFARRRVSGRVLDAGSGEGFGAAMLSRHTTVVGLELDPDAAGHAARRYREARFVRADLCHVPVREGSVDGIVCLQVLEHLMCADRFLRSCRGTLRPEGTLVLSTPNRPTFPAAVNPSHAYEYDAEELGALLSVHFEEVEVLGVRHRFPLSALDRFLGEPVQHRLVRVAYPDLPRWLRAILRTVRSWDFAVGRRPERALDLLAVCRSPRS